MDCRVGHPVQYARTVDIACFIDEPQRLGLAGNMQRRWSQAVACFRRRYFAQAAKGCEAQYGTLPILRNARRQLRLVAACTHHLCGGGRTRSVPLSLLPGAGAAIRLVRRAAARPSHYFLIVQAMRSQAMRVRLPGRFRYGGGLCWPPDGARRHGLDPGRCRPSPRLPLYCVAPLRPSQACDHPYQV